MYQMNQNHLDMKPVQVSESNTFIKNLGCFGGLSSKLGPVLIYQPDTITEKQIMIWF